MRSWLALVAVPPLPPSWWLQQAGGQRTSGGSHGPFPLRPGSCWHHTHWHHQRSVEHVCCVGEEKWGQEEPSYLHGGGDVRVWMVRFQCPPDFLLQAWSQAIMLCEQHSSLAAAELCSTALLRAYPHCQRLWLQHLTMQSAEGTRQRASVAADMSCHGLQPPAP